MTDEDRLIVLFEEWKRLDAAAQLKLRELLELERKVKRARIKPPEPVIRLEG